MPLMAKSKSRNCSRFTTVCPLEFSHPLFNHLKTYLVIESTKYFESVCMNKHPTPDQQKLKLLTRNNLRRNVIPCILATWIAFMAALISAT